MRIKEETFLREEISLEDSIKANLIFKKFFTDHKYRELISTKFKYKYFEDFDISIATALSIKYYNKYNKIPEIDVLKSIVNKALEKDKRFSAKLVNSSIDVALENSIEDEYLIRNSIVDFIASRTAFNVILNNLEKIKEQKDVGYILKELSDIEALKVDDDLGFLYFREIQEHIEELKNPESRFPTGYRQLDRILNGGWLTNGRMLSAFLGCSHSGKSLVLSNLAVNALRQNKFVVVISLEMSELVYGSRIDAHLSSLDVNKLQFNTDELGSRVNSFKKLYPKSELVIKEFATNSINARHLDSYLEKVEKYFNRKIDIVYLDYLTLLNPVNTGAKSLYEKGAEVAKDVRALTYKHNLPIITAIQSSREGFNSDKLGMENISESISIAQTLDCIISIFSTDEDKVVGITRMEVLKNRLGGRVGETLAFEIDYNNLKITETSKEEFETSSTVKKVVDELDNELEDL